MDKRSELEIAAGGWPDARALNGYSHTKRGRLIIGQNHPSPRPRQRSNRFRQLLLAVFAAIVLGIVAGSGIHTVASIAIMGSVAP